MAINRPHRGARGQGQDGDWAIGDLSGDRNCPIYHSSLSDPARLGPGRVGARERAPRAPPRWLDGSTQRPQAATCRRPCQSGAKGRARLWPPPPSAPLPARRHGARRGGLHRHQMGEPFWWLERAPVLRARRRAPLLGLRRMLPLDGPPEHTAPVWTPARRHEALDLRRLPVLSRGRRRAQGAPAAARLWTTRGRAHPALGVRLLPRRRTHARDDGPPLLRAHGGAARAQLRVVPRAAESARRGGPGSWGHPPPAGPRQATGRGFFPTGTT